MTFEDFKGSVDQWMRSGRQSWFICGNYDVDDAKELVSSSQDSLMLQSTRIENLPET